jgi:hypothetical protein
VERVEAKESRFSTYLLVEAFHKIQTFFIFVILYALFNFIYFSDFKMWGLNYTAWFLTSPFNPLEITSQTYGSYTIGEVSNFGLVAIIILGADIYHQFFSIRWKNQLLPRTVLFAAIAASYIVSGLVWIFDKIPSTGTSIIGFCLIGYIVINSSADFKNYRRAKLMREQGKVAASSRKVLAYVWLLVLSWVGLVFLFLDNSSYWLHLLGGGISLVIIFSFLRHRMSIVNPGGADTDDALSPTSYDKVGKITKTMFYLLQNWRYLLSILGACLVVILFRAQGASPEIEFFGAGYLVAGGFVTVSLTDLLNGIGRLQLRGEEIPRKIDVARRVASDAWKTLSIVIVLAAAVLGITTLGKSGALESETSLELIMSILIASSSCAIALVFWERMLIEGKMGRNPRPYGIFFAFVMTPVLAFGFYQLSVAAGVSLVVFTISAFAPTVILSLLVNSYVGLDSTLQGVKDFQRLIDKGMSSKMKISDRLSWLQNQPRGTQSDGRVAKLREQYKVELNLIDRNTARYKNTIKLYHGYVSDLTNCFAAYASRRRRREMMSLTFSQPDYVAPSDSISEMSRTLGKPPQHLPKSYLRTARFKLVKSLVFAPMPSLILNSITESPLGFDSPKVIKIARHLDRVTYEQFSPDTIREHMFAYETAEMCWAMSVTRDSIIVRDFYDFLQEYRAVLERATRTLRERIELFDKITEIDPHSQYAAVMKIPLANRQRLVQSNQAKAELLRTLRKACHGIDKNLLQQDFGCFYESLTMLN